MNYLAIDYGTKRIGLAVSTMGIITPIKPLKNDEQTIENITKVIKEYKIEKVFIGISEGEFATKTKVFAKKLSSMIKLSVETIEEAVSTIEADEIYLNNRKKKKVYNQTIDSIAAAVILRRAIG